MIEAVFKPYACTVQVFPTASPAPSITSLADLGAELEQHFLEQDIWVILLAAY